MFATIASVVVVLGTLLVSGSTQAGASSPADQGVTSTTIRIGISVIDFAALRAVGVTLNYGNYQHAVSALTADMNAHGGVDGRKVVPYFVVANPAVASSTSSSCSELTEDDKVFIVLFPVYPDCYQQTHDTPVIGGVLPGPLPASAAPDFSLTPPDAAYDPLQLAAFDKRGVFKGKKVGLFYGPDDTSEAKVVQSDLKKLHVNVVASAEDGVTATDTVAVDQQAQTIALRFKDAGVNEVIGVGGTGAVTWPRALQDNQSTYKPPWIATNVTALSSYMASAKGKNPYLDNVMASTPLSSVYQVWMDPAVQKCAAIIHKAYPSDPIARAGQSEQSSGCVEWFEHDICRGGGRLSGPGDLYQDRRCRREESDGGELHQGVLSAQKCHFSRFWWTCLVRTRSDLRHRQGERGCL